jgi:hypothetical protein
MTKQQGSKTLILVCRQAFTRIVERVLLSEGFTNFQRGGRTAINGLAIEPKESNSDIFVLITDVNSAMRLAGILRACPIQGGTSGLFEFYLIGN